MRRASFNKLRVSKIRKTVLYGLLLFTFLLSYTSSALAMDASIYNDTVWYAPEATTSGCTTTLVGSGYAEQAWNYFKSPPRSLSDAQTAAILGNFWEESGINPKRVQNTRSPEGDSDVNPLDGKTGYGIAQWTSLGRQQGLSKLATDTGRSVSSLDLQLDYAWQEMTDSSPNDVADNLKAISGSDFQAINTATRYFHSSFEASADGETGIRERVRAAVKFFNLYGGGGVEDSGSGSSTCSGAEPGEACLTGDVLGWQLSGPCKMVSYDQGDPKWANVPYGQGKTPIADSGCGPTSLAMVGATLLRNTSITPETVATKYGDSYHIEKGTSWALFPVYAKDTGLNFKDLGTDLNAAAEIIRSGGLVVISVDPGHFTGSGHLMVLRAVSQDGSLFYIADPNGDGYSNDSETRGFTAEFLRTTGSMKHLWGYTK